MKSEGFCAMSWCDDLDTLTQFELMVGR